MSEPSLHWKNLFAIWSLKNCSSSITSEFGRLVAADKFVISENSVFTFFRNVCSVNIVHLLSDTTQSPFLLQFYTFWAVRLQAQFQEWHSFLKIKYFKLRQCPGKLYCNSVAEQLILLLFLCLFWTGDRLKRLILFSVRDGETQCRTCNSTFQGSFSNPQQII